MSQVYRFNKLPTFLQQRVKERLIANGFSDFEDIAEDLSGMGYRISKSSLHRVSQLMRQDSEWLRAWALANPAQATALVASLQAGGKVNVTTEVTA